MAMPVAIIDASGCFVPDYDEILTWMQGRTREIYGADLYLEPDSQDGEMLAVYALGASDCYALGLSAYNSFSPATAQGIGLSNVVKINGIARNAPSYGSVDVVIGGVAGTQIINGIVGDGTTNSRWFLPPLVTIPPDGDITVTATAEFLGDIRATPTGISRIITPTRNWQSVTNPGSADPGDPVESDAALRRRQAQSVALPSRTVLEGLLGALEGVSGVTRLTAVENDTATTDGNGVPRNSIAIVIEGGDANVIADIIAKKKTPGAGTYGTTAITVTNSFGISNVIRFSRPTLVPITVEITIEALAGYTNTIGDKLKQAVADYINELKIGKDVLITKLYLPANLSGDPDGDTFDLTVLQISRDGDAVSGSNVDIAWNEAATCDAADIDLTVT